MSRRTLNILGILILMGITSAVSILAYVYIIGGSGEPSQAISAPTLTVPTPNMAETQVAVLSTQVAELSAALAAGGATVEATAESVETVEPTAEATAETVSGGAQASAPTLYRIIADQSQVSFTLTEDLRGVPTTVIGTTNQVAGDILVDFAAPASSQVGQIRINARTLSTDSEFRNRAIRGEILESSKDEYEFIEFTPTAITGLPASIAPGDTVTFQVVGDLKIRTITQSVTFNVTATAMADRLEGSATTVVTRSQYNLVIPNAPGVANVSEEVTLQIDFVATPVQQ